MNKKQVVEVIMIYFQHKDPAMANDRLFQIRIHWETGGVVVNDTNGGNGYQLHNGQAKLIGWRNLFKDEVLFHPL